MKTKQVVARDAGSCHQAARVMMGAKKEGGQGRAQGQDQDQDLAAPGLGRGLVLVQGPAPALPLAPDLGQVLDQGQGLALNLGQGHVLDLQGNQAQNLMEGRNLVMRDPVVALQSQEGGHQGQVGGHPGQGQDHQDQGEDRQSQEEAQGQIVSEICVLLRVFLKAV